jgi:hypothetical protein
MIASGNLSMGENTIDRRPDFLRALREYGKTKWFIQERESRKYATAALGRFSSSAVSYD